MKEYQITQDSLEFDGYYVIAMFPEEFDGEILVMAYNQKPFTDMSDEELVYAARTQYCHDRIFETVYVNNADFSIEKFWQVYLDSIDEDN